jgi:aspartate ammonia-lyase
MTPTTRIEHDFLGERHIPSGVYYGIQTLRAMENFAITGIPIKAEPLFVQALAYVKKSSACSPRPLPTPLWRLATGWRAASSTTSF